MSEKRIIFNKKYLAKIFSLSLLLMIFVTGCGRKAVETSDRDKKTTESVTEATTGENADAGADRVDEDSKMNSSSTAKTASDKSFELVAGKTFKVVGSVFALEWSDEVTINDDGSFDGYTVSGGETESSMNYSGKFGSLDTDNEDLIYSAKVESGAAYFEKDGEITFYDKGFPINMLPEDVKLYLKSGLYASILDLHNLPCMIFWNHDDRSVYADASYTPPKKSVTEAATEAVTEAAEEPPTSSMNSPFYGVWVYGAKDKADADNFAANVSGMTALVFLTTDWSNLNSEPYYVVSLGMYTNESDANGALETAKGLGYTDAYVKYSGDHR